MPEGDINVDQFSKCVNDSINEDKNDAGLDLMYSLLLNDQKATTIDFPRLKKINEELGYDFNDSELQAILNAAGNGREINIDQFINFMKPKEKVLGIRKK